MIDPRSLGLFSNIEKLTEIRTAFVFWGLILFIDCGLLLLNGSGFLDVMQASKPLKQRLLIELVLLLAGFSCFTSTVMPLITDLLYRVANFTIVPWAKRLAGLRPGGSDATLSMQNYPRGFVPLHELRDKAHHSRDLYYMDLLSEALNKETANRRLTLYAMTDFVLAIVNFQFPSSGPNSASILQHVASHLGGDAVMWGIIALSAVPAFRSAFRNLPEPVYCPALYGELQEAAQKRPRDELFRPETFSHSRLMFNGQGSSPRSSARRPR